MKTRCACRGTGRLSTFTIDGELPERFVSCPWCPTGREVANAGVIVASADTGSSGEPT